MSEFWQELKRRHVVRVAVAYAVASWLILQLADVLIPLLSLPVWVGRLVFLLLLIGLPVALLLAWAFELTPEGIKREKDAEQSDSDSRPADRKSNLFIISALAAVLILGIIGQFWVRQSPPSDDFTDSLRSIAVLPFENRSAESENAAFFSDGIHDELLTRLAKVSDLRVISRTSMMAYQGTIKNMRQIGTELGVGSILQGGVQRAGDTIRINVQLINTHDDEHIWAESYERELSAANIFAIQSDIAKEISNALKATLTPEDEVRLESIPTDSLEALEAYFVGKQLADQRTKYSIDVAITRFEQAIEYDPNFALAHAGLAYAWLLLPEYSASVDRGLTRRNSENAAARALELNPRLPEGLTVMGWNHLIHEYDWLTAENLLREALNIQANNPDALHWLSHVVSWQGRHEEAVEIAERAVEVDPLSPLMNMNLSYILMDARQYERSVEIRDETLKLQPDYPELWRNMWLTFLRADRYDEATDALTSWAIGTGRDPDAAVNLSRSLQRHAETNSRVDLPQKVLDELEIGSENLGQVYAAAGDGEAALAALQIAVDERAGSRSVLSMKINPLYDFIRDDPRFVEIQKQAGLSQ